MKNAIKTLIWIVVIVVIIIIGWYFGSKQSIDRANGHLKIGAILPITGNGAFYGEQIRNGMQIALDEWKAKGVNVDVVYEDSKLLPAEG